MKAFIGHPSTRNKVETRFASDINSGVTTIVTKNNKGFANGDFIVLGNVGWEQAEIVKVNGAISGNTDLTVTATKFPHSADTRIVYIGWDKIRVYKSTTGINGTYSIVTTIDIQIDQDGTSYIDSSTSTTDYYKFCTYNSVTDTEGDFTDPVSTTGFVFYSAKTMVDRVLSLFGDSGAEFVSREEVLEYINELLEKATQEAVLATGRYNIKTHTFTVQSGVSDYILPSNFLMEKGIKISTDGGNNFNYSAVQRNWDSLGTTINTNVKYGYIISDGVLHLENPTPSNSSDIVKVYYVEVPSLLSDPSDTLPNPFINASAMFIKYGVAMCLLKDKKMEEYGTLRNESEDRLKSHISFLKRLSNMHPEYTEIADTRYI